MGRSAHCPPGKRALLSLPLGDANRGVRDASGEQSGEPAAPTPRAAGFSISGADSGLGQPGFVQSDGPVRTQNELVSVRALGRAAAAVVLLPAILRRVGVRQDRPGSERELESLSRVAGELARSADIDGVVRTLLDELAALFEVGFVGLT